MKKFTTVLLGTVVAVSLAACGNGQEAATQPAADSAATSTDTAATAVPTAEELLNKASQAAEGVKSYSADALIKQDITVSVDDQKQEVQNETSTKMEIVQEPLSAHMNLSTKSNGAEQKQEIYITSDAVYVNAGGAWQKAPESAQQQFLDLIKQQGTLKDTIDRVQSMKNEATVTEEGDTYVMTAKLSGDEVKEKAQEFLNSDASNPQMAEMMKQMNIEDMDLTYKMDKATSNLVGAQVKITMDTEQQGQKVNLVMDMDTTYSNYNELTEIQIPDEVKNSVQ